MSSFAFDHRSESAWYSGSQSAKFCSSAVVSRLVASNLLCNFRFCERSLPSVLSVLDRLSRPCRSTMFFSAVSSDASNCHRTSVKCSEVSVREASVFHNSAPALLSAYVCALLHWAATSTVLAYQPNGASACCKTISQNMPGLRGPPTLSFSILSSAINISSTCAWQLRFWPQT